MTTPTPPRSPLRRCLPHLPSLATIPYLLHVIQAAPVVITAQPHPRPTPVVTEKPVPEPAEEAKAPTLRERCRGLDKLAESAAEARWSGRLARLEQKLTWERQLREKERQRLQDLHIQSLGQPTAPRVPPRASGPKVTVRSSQVRLLGSDAMVTGVLGNSGARDARSRITVELLLDGRVYDRAHLKLIVPAGGSAPFSKRFHTSLATGTYAARVRVR